MSAYVVVVAAREGVSGPTLLRMLGNIALETVVGIVPVLGDIFDAGWKANVKNVRLLDAHLETPDLQRKASVLMVGIVFLGLAALAVLAVWSTLWIVRTLIQAVVALGWAPV